MHKIWQKKKPIVNKAYSETHSIQSTTKNPYTKTNGSTFLHINKFTPQCIFFLDNFLYPHMFTHCPCTFFSIPYCSSKWGRKLFSLSLREKKVPFQVAVEFPTFLLVSVSTQCVYIRLPTVSSDKVDLEFQINLFSLVWRLK